MFLWTQGNMDLAETRNSIWLLMRSHITFNLLINKYCFLINIIFSFQCFCSQSHPSKVIKIDCEKIFNQQFTGKKNFKVIIATTVATCNESLLLPLHYRAKKKQRLPLQITNNCNRYIATIIATRYNRTLVYVLPTSYLSPIYQVLTEGEKLYTYLLTEYAVDNRNQHFHERSKTFRVMQK